ncbi:MAG: hypothetical protein GX130_08070 [Candidatus Hydrogenedens sp.]|jgi:hypothetical protein|nr:hypothetical protein [Candidatus Hydrogenedens sp.]
MKHKRFLSLLLVSIVFVGLFLTGNALAAPRLAQVSKGFTNAQNLSSGHVATLRNCDRNRIIQNSTKVINHDFTSANRYAHLNLDVAKVQSNNIPTDGLKVFAEVKEKRIAEIAIQSSGFNASTFRASRILCGAGPGPDPDPPYFPLLLPLLDTDEILRRISPEGLERLEREKGRNRVITGW